MSTVYLAHDPHFERDVAVKLLPLELLHQSTFRRRFEREAKVVAALDHPAIVPVYDFGEEAGQPFLVMRFMPGGSLSDRLRQGALSIKEASAIMSRLAPALDEVHAHGIIHRDLKPSNILFDQRSDPYISDFGTAKLTQAQTRLTDTGGAVGTPAYMSPEQIQGDAELDGRSDIYSLGIILFEMLTGKHPYQTSTPIAVAVKHIFEPVPHILDMVPNLPVECHEIIIQTMSKERTERYVTATAFAADLARVADKIETKVLRALSHDQAELRRNGRYALLINNNEFDDPILSQLVKPGADHNELAEVLQDPAIGGFDDVTILNNEPAHTIRRSISQFFADRQQDDLLLLYYTGHAAVGSRSRLYLAANNTEHNLLRGTAIPAAFVADEMDNSQSIHQILILDCHFSNAVNTELPSLVGQTVNSGATFARNGHDRVVITATDSTQYNWHKDKVRGKAAPSQFTRHLIHGLRSGAADINQDGDITLNELFAYIYDRISRNSIDEQIQVPRKWTPYEANEGNDLIIANVVTGSNTAVSGIIPYISRSRKPSAIATRFGSFPKSAVRWATLAIMLAAVGLLFVLGSRGSWAAGGDQTAAAANAAAATAVSPTATFPPTATTESTPIMEVIETATVAASETAVVDPIATTIELPESTTPVEPTEIATTNIMTATALLSSSLFVAPNSDSQEITFVGVGETVEILGRSESSEWLYVRTKENEEGFIYGPRFDWEGDYETLTIVNAAAPAPTNTPVVDSCNGGCPMLTIDLYDLPSARCAQTDNVRTIYIQGHGGNETYTYYWNNEYVAGPLTARGFGFDITSPDASAVIGRGKVVSGDGQVVDKELFVSNFSCDN
ncbi:MAG: protein kinase [Anaerolineales bacterium]|nr:protein kinase [Anaerolineales bacterium]